MIPYVTSARIVEAKQSGSKQGPRRKTSIPKPLHKTHVGVWWFFPEGGVDV